MIRLGTKYTPKFSLTSRSESIVQTNRYNRNIHLSLEDHFLQSYDGRMPIKQVLKTPTIPPKIIGLWNIGARKSFADYYIQLRSAMKTKIKVSTIFRTFFLLDRVLIQRDESQDCSLIMTRTSSSKASHLIDTEELQLLVATCFFIASKKEDVYHITSNEITRYIFRNKFSIKRILKSEVDTLTRLNFDLGGPLPDQIVEYFVSIYFKFLGVRYATQLIGRTRLTLYLSLYDPAFSVLRADQLAAVAIIAAVKIFDVMRGQTLYEDCTEKCKINLYKGLDMDRRDLKNNILGSKVNSKKARNTGFYCKEKIQEEKSRVGNSFGNLKGKSRNLESKKNFNKSKNNHRCDFFYIAEKEEDCIALFLGKEKKMFESFDFARYLEKMMNEYKLTRSKNKNYVFFNCLIKNEYPNLKKEVLSKIRDKLGLGVSKS